MKKIIGLTIAIILTVSTVSTGIWAFYSDAESSANNRLTAGTLDLKTNDNDGVTQTLNATSLKANDSTGPGTITLRNAGSLNGAILSIVFAYSESDGSPNTYNRTANDTAAIIEVTTLTYGGSSLLTSINDSNSNGYKDFQDLKNASLSNLSGITAGATKDLTINVKVRDGINNNFQGDGVNATVMFTLNQ